MITDVGQIDAVLPFFRPVQKRKQLNLASGFWNFYNFLSRHLATPQWDGDFAKRKNNNTLVADL
jgi:hypothetical protein